MIDDGRPGLTLEACVLLAVAVALDTPGLPSRQVIVRTREAAQTSYRRAGGALRQAVGEGLIERQRRVVVGSDGQSREALVCFATAAGRSEVRAAWA
ncbi:MAG: hypothetical protein F4098_07155, partial [Acidimicrobiaceae bacterium]|nr:hypothetical protein [Acidimicrobiaceae bacterium]